MAGSKGAGTGMGHDASQNTSTSVTRLAPQPSYGAASVDSFIPAGQKRKLKLQEMSKWTKILYLSAERWALALVSCLLGIICPWLLRSGLWT